MVSSRRPRCGAELQQRLQGSAAPGARRTAPEVTVLLLFPGVGSVVGGDDVEHVVAYRIQRGVLVGSALHRRVALIWLPRVS